MLARRRRNGTAAPLENDCFFYSRPSYRLRRRFNSLSFRFKFACEKLTAAPYAEVKSLWDGKKNDKQGTVTKGVYVKHRQLVATNGRLTYTLGHFSDFPRNGEHKFPAHVYYSLVCLISIFLFISFLSCSFSVIDIY